MDEIMGLIIVLLIATVTFLWGGWLEESFWEKNCKNDGYHNVRQQKYICYPEKEKQ